MVFRRLALFLWFFHSFPKITVVATPNLFLKPVFFVGLPFRRDFGYDSL